MALAVMSECCDPRGAAAARLDCRDLVTEEHPVSARENAIPAALPHLAPAGTWIPKFGEQALDGRGPLVQRHGRQDGPLERQLLDALGGPFGADLGARDPP